jgi:hypothetical protein
LKFKDVQQSDYSKHSREKKTKNNAKNFIRFFFIFGKNKMSLDLAQLLIPMVRETPPNALINGMVASLFIGTTLGSLYGVYSEHRKVYGTPDYLQGCVFNGIIGGSVGMVTGILFPLSVIPLAIGGCAEIFLKK